jgi:outer membrane protein assembly factor BamB
MNKTLLLIILLAHTCIAVSGQKFKEPELRAAALGNINNQSISGTKITFDYAIYASDFDTPTNSIILVLRVDNPRMSSNNQFLVSINVSTKNINWKKYVHGGNGMLLFTEKNIINSCNGQTRCYSKKDGSTIWQATSDILFTNENKTIGYTAKGQGINLNTGKVLWINKLPYESGIQEVVHVNNNQTIVSADGVHVLNMNNGNAEWSYPAITTITDYEPMYTSMAIGITLAAFTGVFVMTGPNTLTHACSNIQTDSAEISTMPAQVT